MTVIIFDLRPLKIPSACRPKENQFRTRTQSHTHTSQKRLPEKKNPPSENKKGKNRNKIKSATSQTPKRLLVSSPPHLSPLPLPSQATERSSTNPPSPPRFRARVGPPTSPSPEEQRRGVAGHVARLRRPLLLGARAAVAVGGGREGRRGGVRVGVERRGAAAAVRRALRVARVALPRLPPRPRRAVSTAPLSFPLLQVVSFGRATHRVRSWKWSLVVL